MKVTVSGFYTTGDKNLYALLSNKDVYFISSHGVAMPCISWDAFGKEYNLGQVFPGLPQDSYLLKWDDSVLTNDRLKGLNHAIDKLNEGYNYLSCLEAAGMV